MKKKNICYKVVEKRTRYGSNWSIYRAIFFMNRAETLPKPPDSPYFQTYKKGSTIKCVPGSVGIMVFESKRSAKYFASNGALNNDRVMIIKVLGVGKMPHSLILWECGSKPQQLLEEKGRMGHIYVDPPYGTLFFKSVKVLE